MVVVNCFSYSNRGETSESNIRKSQQYLSLMLTIITSVVSLSITFYYVQLNQDLYACMYKVLIVDCILSIL